MAHEFTVAEGMRGRTAVERNRRLLVLRKIANAPAPRDEAAEVDEPQRWDIDELLRNLEERIAHDTMRGGSAFSR